MPSIPKTSKESKIKRFLKIVLGILFLIIGVIGCFLPILQGWAFIFAGIILIWPEKGKKMVAWLKEKINSYRKRKSKDIKKLKSSDSNTQSVDRLNK